MPTKTTHSGFYCQECGHGFRTIAAAQRASSSAQGCPKCGGADIDLGKPEKNAEQVTAKVLS